MNEALAYVQMSFFALGKRSTGTFRPRKEPVGSKQHLLRQFAEATLGSGSLRKAVQLPPGENRQEWIAANSKVISPWPANTVTAVEFYTQINMLWGTVCEFCTEITCPAMTAGPRVRYGWAASSSEPDAGAPRMLPAPAYINALSAWAQGLLDDPAIFPVEIGREFPPDFERVVQVLWKR